MMGDKVIMTHQLHRRKPDVLGCILARALDQRHHCVDVPLEIREEPVLPPFVAVTTRFSTHVHSHSSCSNGSSVEKGRC